MVAYRSDRYAVIEVTLAPPASRRQSTHPFRESELRVDPYIAALIRQLQEEVRLERAAAASKPSAPSAANVPFHSFPFHRVSTRINRFAP